MTGLCVAFQGLSCKDILGDDTARESLGAIHQDPVCPWGPLPSPLSSSQLVGASSSEHEVLRDLDLDKDSDVKCPLDLLRF